MKMTLETTVMTPTLKQSPHADVDRRSLYQGLRAPGRRRCRALYLGDRRGQRRYSHLCLLRSLSQYGGGLQRRTGKARRISATQTREAEQTSGVASVNS